MEQSYFVKLLRRLRFMCNCPRSIDYVSAGAKGTKCLFKRPEQIERLYIRDNAQTMCQPHLSMRNRSKNYSPRNCFFEELRDYYLALEKARMEITVKRYQTQEARRKLLAERCFKRRAEKMQATSMLRQKQDLKSSVDDSIEPLVNTESEMEARIYG